MIAHSFTGNEFGPAQKMHGATYVVDCEFITDKLESHLNWVVDIGEASTVLKEVLSEFNYKNLDELEEFQGQNTTTEFMCRQVFDRVADRFKGKFVGAIRIKMSESHIAWASYTGIVEE
ncbi:hypothetical protein BWQ96_06893 [Gracilariopsis chorda]|uniref:6-pyruvoyltetrahydropterin synthase n=1 Tax=Gracilariopsis chorda TaxID=448386 RepID=A0A2V3IMU5_9FLOR|nr:hypothetical protein BWQ96_06878 [Gracilariopsis chorda]PXF43398.1 hypothetical protein BWQ96_06893 [Gracilariopsis chorda]|eukprot:PXF43383.1 hypothetical protein BWQ96_06878 [Gracilariopsis chorda]